MNFPQNDAAPLAGGAGVNDQSAEANGRLARVTITPACRHDAPDTSREGADTIADSAGTLRGRVYRFFLSRGTYGATDAEIAIICGIPIQSVNPRRGELARLGLIALNGKRRPTPTGCQARVWIASAFAVNPAADAGNSGTAEGGAA